MSYKEQNLDGQIPFNGYLLEKHHILAVQRSGCIQSGNHGLQLTRGALSLESNKGRMKSNSLKQSTELITFFSRQGC